MKVVAKLNTHFTLEFNPEELADITFEHLADAIRNSFPLGTDTAIEIIRNCRAGEELNEAIEQVGIQESRAWRPDEMLTTSPRTLPVKPDPS